MCIRDRVLDRGTTHPYFCSTYTVIEHGFSDTSKNGIQINGVCYKSNRFADNTALLGNNHKELHNMNNLKDWCGLTINRTTLKSLNGRKTENRRQRYGSKENN